MKKQFKIAIGAFLSTLFIVSLAILLVPTKEGKILKKCKEYFKTGRGFSYIEVFKLELKNLHVEGDNCVFEINGTERKCTPFEDSNGKIDCK